MEKAGLLFDAPKFEHEYPHCWRCDTPHLLAAVRAFKSHLINIRPVQLDFYRVGIPASVRKLLPAADALLMAALTLPHI